MSLYPTRLPPMNHGPKNPPPPLTGEALELYRKLSQACQHLSDTDVDFAGSMLGTLKVRGKLSERQEYWAYRLIDRAALNASKKDA